MNLLNLQFVRPLKIFGWLGTLLMILILLPDVSESTQKSSSDCFFIPQNTSIIEIPKEFGGDAWKNANWFTFGTTGHPEVDVLGKYQLDSESKVESLFLAFHIRHDAIPHENDMLTICFDPDNTGIPSAGNVLTRYDIFPHPLQTSYSYCRETNSSGDLMWKAPDQVPPPDFIQTIANWDIVNNTWQAEITIDCQAFDLTGDEVGSFGLYFQVLDFINDDYTFARYHWPVSAHADEADPDYIPPATEWARGHFINSSSNIIPDYYLNYWDLQVNNSGAAFEIQLGAENSFSTKVRNVFIEDAWSGDPVMGTVTFKMAKFGAACYSEHYSANATIVTPPEDVDVYATRTSNGSGKQTITLRGDLTCDQDAITSNNSMVRNMKYLPTIEGKTFKMSVTIANCLSDEAIYSTSEKEDATPPTMSPLYASASPMMPQDDRETFFLYLDRSELDTSKLRDEWDVTFIPAENDSGFLLPVPDSSHKDLYTVLLRPGDSTKFQIQVTAPNYKGSSAGSLPLLQGLFHIHAQNAKAASVAMSNQAIALPPDKLMPLLWLSRSNFQKLFPRGVVSGLKVKVYKHKDVVFKDRKSYFLMNVLNNFGAYVEVMPKPAPHWKFIIIIFTIGLLYVFYICFKSWKKRKWDFLKVILNVILVIDAGLIGYFVWMVRQFFNLGL
ncbi:MAG: hypothetical protein ACOY90_20295 [Candidatus Zhuqueibacterota bacterium]